MFQNVAVNVFVLHRRWQSAEVWVHYQTKVHVTRLCPLIQPSRHCLCAGSGWGFVASLKHLLPVHVCAKGNAPCCAIYRLRSRCPKKIHTITMPAVLGEIKVRLKFYPVLLPWHDSLPDKCSLFLFPSSSSLSCRSACSRSGWMSVPAPSVAGQVAAPTLWTCRTRPQWWIVGLWVLCLWQLNPQRCAPAQAENSPISLVPHIPETPATTVECAWTLSMATGELFSSALFLIFFSYLIPAVLIWDHYTAGISICSVV